MLQLRSGYLYPRLMDGESRAGRSKVFGRYLVSVCAVAALASANTAAASATRARDAGSQAQTHAAPVQRVAVVVEGRRLGRSALIVLQGVRGRAKGEQGALSVRRRETLTSLQPGMYRVTAHEIVAGRRAAVAVDSPRRVRVRANRETVIRIRYRLVPSAQLPLGAASRLEFGRPVEPYGCQLPRQGGVVGEMAGHVYLYAGEGGLPSVVTRRGAGYGRDKPEARVRVATLDPATLRVMSSKSVQFPDFPLLGGFYSSPDGYRYLLVGRDNWTEDDSRAVAAVRKYDSDWNLVGTAYLYGGASQVSKGIADPFFGTGGQAAMELVGSTLVVHTARARYKIDGVNHQSNMTFLVDTQTMSATPYADRFGNAPYVSHSFQQLVRSNGTDLVTADLGDAYPRAIRLNIAPGFAQGNGDFTSHDVFRFMGDVGDNYTGTSLTGLELGQGHALVVGKSVPHWHSIQGVTGYQRSLRRNVYLISTDTGNGSTNFDWLTNYLPAGHVEPTDPRLVQLSETRFAVLYSVPSSGTLHYLLVDQNGILVADKTWAGMSKTMVQPCGVPLLIGSKMYWTGLDNQLDRLFLYRLDVTDPLHPVLLPAGA